MVKFGFEIEIVVENFRMGKSIAEKNLIGQIRDKFPRIVLIKIIYL